MSQLRTLKNAAKLRKMTHLGGLLPNETRWCGKFQMVDRYFRIDRHIQNIESFDQYLPSPAQRRTLEAAIVHFKKFESISVNLQRKGLSLPHVRFVFDEICSDYPIMSKYLSADVDIVHNKAFENAVVKIVKKNESQLNLSLIHI